MAQQRLRDFQSPLGSFLHNLTNLGVHLPGRFCGFDTLQQTGQLQFSLTHANSGINTSDASGNPYGPLGVMMSNQGEILMEDAPITGLSIDNNVGNPNTRLDLVVLNHQYIQLANPAAANYSVVKGILTSFTAPAITRFQTIVGFINIPPGATLISQCTYTKAVCPDSGDSPDAKLIDSPNNFRTINMNNEDSNTYVTPTRVTNEGINLWDLSTKGNSFVFNPVAMVNIDGLRIIGGDNFKSGVEVTLIINQFVNIRNNVTLPLVGVLDQGYCPISFGSRLTAFTQFFLGAPTNVLRPTPGVGTLWILSLLKTGGVWVVKSVDGINFNASNWLKGMTMEVTMSSDDILFFFDETGLGKSDWTGWAMKNSNNGSGNDRRGRIPVGAIDIPSAGAPPVDPSLLPLVGNLNLGSMFGETSHRLNATEIPSMQFGVPGITGGDNNDNNNQQEFAGGDKPHGQGVSFTIAVGNGGGDRAHNNMQPYEATFWVVRIV